MTQRSNEELQAFQVLLDRAQGKFGELPEGLIVDHIETIVRGGEPTLYEAAFEALYRRFRARQRDDLRIAESPAGTTFGVYTTRRYRTTSRPYATHLHSVHPIVGACNCIDFLQNGLGLCKHLFTVLDELAGKARKFKQAVTESPTSWPPRQPYLSWNPVRPRKGLGDWIERIELWSGDQPLTHGWARIARSWFKEGTGCWIVRQGYDDQPRKRQALVDELLQFVKGSRRPEPVADSSLVARLEMEREILQRVLELESSKAALKRAFRSFQHELFPFQTESVERFIARGRMLFADDLGLGKIVQATACAHTLSRAQLVKRGVVITPSGRKHQWLTEWRRLTDTPATLVRGNPQSRQRIYSSTKAGFLIVDHQELWRDLSALLKFDPQMVILDEAGRHPSWATRTETCVRNLRTPYRLALLGVPLVEHLERIAPVLTWIDSDALEPLWQHVHVHHQGQPDVGNVAHPQRSLLHVRLERSTLRRTRKEVIEQISPRRETVRAVDMTRDQLGAHDDLSAPIADLLRASDHRSLTPEEMVRLYSLLTAQRVISGGLVQREFVTLWPQLRHTFPDETTLRRLFSPKLIEFRAIIAEALLAGDRKVVVFSHWRRMLYLARWVVSDLLETHKTRAVVLTGLLSQKERRTNVEEFHDEKTAQILFATDAGGKGLNLQGVATTCIHLDVPWNPKLFEQRIDRIYKSGQKGPIEVYVLMSQDSIETRIWAARTSHANVLQMLFDGTSEEVLLDQEAAFLDLLRDVLEIEKLPRHDDPEDDRVFDLEIPDPIDDLVDATDENADPPSLLEDDTDGRPDLRAILARLQTKDGTDRAPLVTGQDPTTALAELFEDIARAFRSE